MRAIAKFLLRNRGFIAFMLCMVVFRSAVADWNVVPTGSMQPTIRIGDRILVDKLAYDVRLPLTHVSLLHLADPQRGDIVVLDSHAARERLVKRVIGLPGDQVAMRGNMLFINGHAARYVTGSYSGIRDDLSDPAHYEIERYGVMNHPIRLSNYRPSPASSFGPVQVPAGRHRWAAARRRPRQQHGLALLRLLPARRDRRTCPPRGRLARPRTSLPAAHGSLRRAARLMRSPSIRESRTTMFQAGHLHTRHGSGEAKVIEVQRRSLLATRRRQPGQLAPVGRCREQGQRWP